MKKLFKIVIITLLIASWNSIIPSNAPQQSFADWFWSYFASSTPKTPEEATRQKKQREYWQKSSTLKKVIDPLKVSAISGGAVAMAEAAATVVTTEVMKYLIEDSSFPTKEAAVAIGLVTGTGTFFLIGFITIMAQLNTYATERNRDATKQKMKEPIEKIIFGSSLYPTRSSKLHALLKKDEFLKYVELYIQDLDGILEDVCQELSLQISEADYSEEQRNIDREIDDYIASLKKSIAHLSLAEQIAMLKNSVDVSSIDHMRGYLSLYDRLRNKLVIETYLKKQGKNFADPFNLEAVRKMIPTEQKSKKEEWEALKQSEQGQAWDKKWQDKLVKEKQNLDEIKQEIEREQDEESKRKYQKQLEIVKSNLEKAELKKQAAK